jgi:lysyl-tRNA synthetase class 2
MKRLLAAGIGDIYQMCKVFRDGERGRHHNVEFTMLEWYRTGIDHHALMDEVAELLRVVLGAERVDPVQRMSFRAALERHAGLDPFDAGADDCGACLAQAGVAVPSGCGREELLDLIAGEVVGPRLGRGGAAFVYDYPAGRAALAHVRAGDPPVAERFEAYLDGIELANGFHELTDAREQRLRFERDLRARAESAASAVVVDERFLAALEAGMPACYGVALGLDRLVMLAAGAERIDEVIAFPIERA